MDRGAQSLKQARPGWRTRWSHAATAVWAALGTWLGGGGAAAGGVLPSVTDFYPVFGPPGTVVVVDGQNFDATTSVRFNGTPAVSVAFIGPTQIHATVPDGASSGPILVRTSAGFAVSPVNFTVIGAGPFITDFFPTLGAPGDSVQINGVNFTNVTAVQFGGTNARFSLRGPTQIIAAVPTNAIAEPITVATTAGTNTTISNFVAVGYGPFITGFAPDAGLPGDPVVINGLNFANAAAVRFNGTPAPFTITAATQINTTVPANTTTGPITVATPLGTNTSATVFVVGHAPRITDFAPTNGVPGNLVVINGANLLTTTQVLFNGTSAPDFVVTADTQISIAVPAGATTGLLTVVTPDGTNTTAAPFTVLQPPAITSLTPATGPPTTTVTISGTNFVGATDVLFNGAGSIFTVNSTTNITVTVPSTAATGPVLVVTPAGVAISPTSFVVTVPTVPSITGFSPAGGPPGTLVAILGTQFINVIVVRFNGVVASATTVSATEIDALVPAQASSGPITVTTPVGGASSANPFIVGAPPMISSFTPTNGPAGTIVQISGANFSGVSAVQFNGVPAAFKFNSPTQLQAQVPAAAFTGPISISAITGTVLSSADFGVNRIANLLLQQSAPAGAVNLGAVLTNTFILVDSGPSDATGVVFTNALPAGLNFVSATATSGTPSQTNRVVTCVLGGLAAGAEATIVVVVTPTMAGAITNVGAVTANEPDTTPTNRVASAVIRILPPALTIRPVANGLVEVGWPAAAVGFRLQVVGPLLSGTWTGVTATPVSTGGRYLITNAVSGNAGYYRLRQGP